MENSNQNQQVKTGWISHELIELQNKKQAVAYLYMILTFFTVAFFGFFVINPAISTISNLQKELNDNKLVYQELQNKLATIQKLDKEYQTIQTSVPLVYNAIPKSSDITLLTRQIEKLAQNRNVNLVSFSVSPIEFYPLDSGNFTFTLDGTSSQQNINSFIDDLSSFNRVVSIDKISTGKADNGQVELSFAGKAYFKASEK